MTKLAWALGLAPIALYLAAKIGFPMLLPAIPVPSPAASFTFDPIAFFEGNTNGSGTLATVTGSRQALTVTSVGKPVADGLELTQRIDLEGKEPRMRKWVIRDEGDNRYGGSLTDARGDVTAFTGGRRMVIVYETEDSTIRQTLTQSDEDTVLNRLDVYKWGLNVARLDETIARE